MNSIEMIDRKSRGFTVKLINASAGGALGRP